jgi:hypothetical protein
LIELEGESISGNIFIKIKFGGAVNFVMNFWRTSSLSSGISLLPFIKNHHLSIYFI